MPFESRSRRDGPEIAIRRPNTRPSEQPNRSLRSPCSWPVELAPGAPARRARLASAATDREVEPAPLCVRWERPGRLRSPGKAASVNGSGLPMAGGERAARAPGGHGGPPSYVAIGSTVAGRCW